MNTGAAKSLALGNAADSLGEVFGRNVGRDDVELREYNDVFERAENYSEVEKLRDQAGALLVTSKFAGNPKLLADIKKADAARLQVIIENLNNAQL